MIQWDDIAGIVCVCVTMNHLGLVKAIEDTWDRELPSINCVKCSTFWSVLIYTSFTAHDVIASLAVSFLCSYIAIWLELFEGFIDTLYLKLYGKIYKTSDNAPATNPDKGNSASTLPKL